MLTVKTVDQQRIFLNEKRLFHGTSPDTVEAICKQNFDWRLHGKNATMYGEGSYFALNASYSDAYAKEDANSCRFMFVAKVLVGSYTEGYSSYRRPPPKNLSNPASDLYDSCVDDKLNPTIFVVFDTDQFYPEYIIKYSHATSTAAMSRSSSTSGTASRSHSGASYNYYSASASNTSSTTYQSPTSGAYSGPSSGYYTSSPSSTSSTRYQNTPSISSLYRSSPKDKSKCSVM